MSGIKEINRRCEISEEREFACGQFGITAVCAEMEIEQDGKRLFLICEWVDEVSDTFCFEVTEESIFDTLVMKDNDFDRLERIREKELEIYLVDEEEYDGDYLEQYKILAEMVMEKLRKEDLVDEEVLECLSNWYK